MTNNTFQDFNFLKDGYTDAALSRKQSQLGRVPIQSGSRNVGFILDINCDFNFGYVQVSDNVFKNIRLFNRVEGSPPDHCDTIDQEPTYLQYQMYLTDSNTYIQFFHLLNMRNLTQTTILISNNLFYNLSLAGPLINIASSNVTNQQTIALVNNTFNLIHSYIGTAVMSVMRYYSDESDNLIGYGGGVLMQGNNFSEIVGCPAVDTGLIFFGVMDQKGSG